MTLPQWNRDEYNCLTRDLRGPLACWGHIQSVQKLERVRARLRDLERRPLKGQRLRHAVEDGMKRAVDRKPSGEERQQFVAHHLERYSEACHKASMYPQFAQEAEAILQQIIDCYISVEIEAFQDDFAVIIAGEEADPVEEEIKHLRASERSRKGKVRWDPKQEYLNWVTYVPGKWRDATVGPKFPEHKMAELICTQFLEDWRRRAPLFDEDVTINGVAISSLPHDQKLHWEAAYAELELGELKKRPTYAALYLDPVDEEDDLVPAFQPRGKES